MLSLSQWKSNSACNRVFNFKDYKDKYRATSAHCAYIPGRPDRSRYFGPQILLAWRMSWTSGYFQKELGGKKRMSLILFCVCVNTLRRVICAQGQIRFCSVRKPCMKGSWLSVKENEPCVLLKPLVLFQLHFTGCHDSSLTDWLILLLWRHMLPSRMILVCVEHTC